MDEAAEQSRLEASTHRWMVAGLILMVLFAGVFPVFRWYEPSRRAEARADQRAFLAAQGEALFSDSCASCHGVGGAGALAPAVGSREFLEAADDTQIEQLIAHGIPGSEMVAYSIDLGGPLTSEQIEAIGVYLRSLESAAPSNALWRTPLADESLGGRDLFVMACSRCHGADLSGIEGVAPRLGPGSDATEEPDARLASRIREGEDDMPRFGTVLTSEQIDQIVAYLREVQGR